MCLTLENSEVGWSRIHSQSLHNKVYIAMGSSLANPRPLFMEVDQRSNQWAGKVMKYSTEQSGRLRGHLIINNPPFKIVIPIIHPGHPAVAGRKSLKAEIFFLKVCGSHLVLHQPSWSC